MATTDGTAGRSLVHLFLDTVRRKPHETAARFKHAGIWTAVSWKEVEERARALAAGLIALGLEPGERVSILGGTRLEWVLAELAVHMSGGVSVPIYQSLRPADVGYIARDAASVFIFVENDEQLDKVRQVEAKLDKVRKLIRLEGAGDGDRVLDLVTLASLGDAHQAEHPASVDERIAGVRADDAACFIYTSGTTGPPKGVVLAHSSWAYEAEAVSRLGLIRDDDEQILWLPLAHSFAQVVKAAWFKLGHPMAFAENLDRLVQNMAEVKPTVMASVPRIFEKAFAKVTSGGFEAPGFKGRMFRWAMNHFERYAKERREGRKYRKLGFFLADKLVFGQIAKKLAASFGGRVRFFISGGAPLSPKIAYFFELAGITILEGYGLTETSAATCVNLPDRVKIGTVGPPVPGTEVHIAPDGEILVRGPGVMKGYHGLDEATNEAIDRDGWFHTGDVGVIDEDGHVRITDRKKDIIVNAGGKNIAPQNLENALKTHPLVSQVVVHGDKRKFLSALITLDEAASKKWAEEAGLALPDHATLCRESALLAEIERALEAMAEDFPPWEAIRKFRILETDFTLESGELTPTLKVKRRVIEERYRSILDGFYGGEGFE